jgi:hypothetical protein
MFIEYRCQTKVEDLDHHQVISSALSTVHQPIKNMVAQYLPILQMLIIMDIKL